MRLDALEAKLCRLLEEWRGRDLVLGFKSGFCVVEGPCKLAAISETHISFSLQGMRKSACEINIPLRGSVTRLTLAPFEQMAERILGTVADSLTEEDIVLFHSASVEAIADVQFANGARLMIGARR